MSLSLYAEMSSVLNYKRNYILPHSSGLSVISHLEVCFAVLESHWHGVLSMQLAKLVSY